MWTPGKMPDVPLGSGPASGPPGDGSSGNMPDLQARMRSTLAPCFDGASQGVELKALLGGLSG